MLIFLKKFNFLLKTPVLLPNFKRSVYLNMGESAKWGSIVLKKKKLSCSWKSNFLANSNAFLGLISLKIIIILKIQRPKHLKNIVKI